LSALSLVACVAGGALECRYRPALLVETHGGELYERMCAVCHGRSGEGYKADNAPAIAHPDFLASATDAYLREAIAHGRAGSTMSAWGAERGGPLVAADVDAVVAFMRSWDRGERVELDSAEPKGDAARGEGTYARSCASCHGARGVSGSAVHIGDPGLLASASDGFLRYAIQKGRAGTAMPPFASTLGKDAIEDVLTLLRSWQAHAPRAARPPAAHPPPLPLGPVPLHPTGPEPVGFRVTPLTTPADVIKAQLDRGSKMALLDARAPSDYAREHIAGAVSVPFYDPEPYLSALPKDAWLVCYCACPHAESGTLAGKLVGHGFSKVTVLDEGLGVWKSRGYGTHLGLEP
jgi:cytochrome c oxidase cbb3-type subunit 3/ubiquinol-cytochrome c reductase cytochrome c subunit